MRIQYLGTAAAEGIPALFCNCPVCKEAEKRGGKNIRTRSQVIINDDLLVDFPADTYMHKLKYNLDLSKIQTLIVTHGHPDHWYPEDLGMRGSFFAHRMQQLRLDILMTKKTKDIFDRNIPKGFSQPIMEGINFHIAEHFKTEKYGRYQITPLPSRHGAPLGENACIIFLISDGEKTMLYGNDSGILYDEVYEFLKGKKLDLVSLDCTLGADSDGSNHMGFSDDVKVVGKLTELGCVSSATKVVVTHFSHNGKVLFEDVEQMASPHKFIAAYDGLTLEL